MTTRCSRWLLVGILFNSLCSLGVAQQSTTYLMEGLTVASGATVTESTTYANSVTLAQGTPAGAMSSCSAVVNSLGFWSVIGDLEVPVRLTVEVDPTDPDATLLSWTGAAGMFETYRAVDPADIFQGTPTEVAACETSDPQSWQEDLIFYVVVPKTQ